MKNALLLHGTGGNPNVFWLPWLKKELEKQGYKVTVPKLPNPERPTLKEVIPFLLNKYNFDAETVMYGHSSGGPIILSLLENMEAKINKAILVAGFFEPLGGESNPILQAKYNWERISKHAQEFIFINSDNDPWGCNDKQGKKLQEKLGGQFVLMHDGHMGSDKFNQPYKEFPLLLELL